MSLRWLGKEPPTIKSKPCKEVKSPEPAALRVRSLTQHHPLLAKA
jgi:hypothetical protein